MMTLTADLESMEDWQASLALLGQIHPDKLVQLAKRQMDQMVREDKVKLHPGHLGFSREERVKLESALDLDSSQELDLLLRSTHHILDCLARHAPASAAETAQDAGMKSVLISAGLDETRSGALARIWLQWGRPLVEKRRRINILGGSVLESVDYSVNLELDSNYCPAGDGEKKSGNEGGGKRAEKLKSEPLEPHVSSVFQLSIRNDVGKRENVIMELDEERLMALYNILEEIQQKLDELK